MSPARLRPQHTALLAGGPQVPRRVNVGCPTRAELSPSRPAFAGSEAVVCGEGHPCLGSEVAGPALAWPACPGVGLAFASRELRRVWHDP